MQVNLRIRVLSHFVLRGQKLALRLMSKPLKKLLTGESVGKYLAPRPTMTTRSQRETTATSHRGTEGETVPHRVSTNDQQKICGSIPVTPGDHFQTSNLESECIDEISVTSGRYNMVSSEAQTENFPGRSIRHSGTSTGPGEPPVPQTKTVPTVQAKSLNKTNDSYFYEADRHPVKRTDEKSYRHHRRQSSRSSGGLSKKAIDHCKIKERSNRYLRRESSSSPERRPTKTIGESRKNRILHEHEKSFLFESESSEYSTSEFDFSQGSDSDISKRKRKKHKKRKRETYRREDFPKLPSNDMMSAIKMFERHARRRNITKKSDLLEAAIMVFPENKTQRYFASLQNNEVKSYASLKRHLIKYAKPVYSCHTADQFYNPKKSVEDVNQLVDKMLMEPKSELRKYLLASVCPQFVKDRMRKYFRYDEDRFSLALSEAMDDYKRGNSQQQQYGRKHPPDFQLNRQRQNQHFPKQIQQVPQPHFVPKQQTHYHQPIEFAQPRSFKQPQQFPVGRQNQQGQSSSCYQPNNNDGRFNFVNAGEQKDGLCYYHSRYGNMAFKCEGPCKMANSQVPKNE